jgi:hypothetical protein
VEKEEKYEFEQIQTTAPLVAKEFSVKKFSCRQFWDDAIVDKNF